jgi:hypothetical protein
LTGLFTYFAKNIYILQTLKLKSSTQIKKNKFPLIAPTNLDVVMSSTINDDDKKTRKQILLTNERCARVYNICDDLVCLFIF